jgi:hypothetical protein
MESNWSIFSSWRRLACIDHVVEVCFPGANAAAIGRPLLTAAGAMQDAVDIARVKWGCAALLPLLCGGQDRDSGLLRNREAGDRQPRFLLDLLLAPTPWIEGENKLRTQTSGFSRLGTGAASSATLASSLA